MDAIVLAAGIGTRMAPLTPSLAKPLLPVAGRSLLARMLDGLAHAGVSRAVVVTHHLAADVEAEARAHAGGMELAFAPQGEPRGTGHAVAAGAAHVDGDALVVMGDALVEPAVLRSLASSSGFTLAAAKVADPRSFGALEVSGDRVVDLAEKSDRPPSDLANSGLYRVPAEALRETSALRPSPRGELEFTDVVKAWAARGDVRWIPAEGWMDVGAPWDLLVAQERWLPRTLDTLLGKAQHGGPGTVEPNVQVRGRLWVGEGAIVKSGVYIEGDVLVGAGARVGPNSYIRGPTVVSAGCHVGAAVELKASLLLPKAATPHLNYVGDSVLGPDVNLGAGTKVANLKVTDTNVRAGTPKGLVDTGRRKFGVCLGPRVKTGINASLLPGAMVGAGSLLNAGGTYGGWIPPGSRLL